jgi:hypothetical protein
MAPADGSVLGTTTIVDHGSPGVRWNLVVIGDGYRSAELAQYRAHAERFCEFLFSTPPFEGLQQAINIFRIDVSSTDSGADDPIVCGGTGATAATYFDATFCGFEVGRRLLIVDSTSAMSVASRQVPEWHSIIVIVNSTILGGAGGVPAVISVGDGWEEGALHELAHSAFGLADEYEYLRGCGQETDHDRYLGVEPLEPNVTVNTNRSTLKWRQFVSAATPIPTTQNDDCTQCDPQPDPMPPGTVGLYAGAYNYHCGAFRPQFDCKMRTLGLPFCRVCSQQIRDLLSQHLPVTVPHVTETPLSFAEQMIISAGLRPKPVGHPPPDPWVWKQSPKGGEIVPQGTGVSLLLKAGPIVTDGAERVPVRSARMG